MKIFCKELNKEFDDKHTMFKALKADEKDIVSLKKAAIKRSDPVMFRIKANEIAKADAPIDETPLKIGDTIYPVINTTNFYDSCGDVHIDGIWDLSIKDQAGKVYYIINHDLEIGKVISYPRDTQPMVKEMTWQQLGLPYQGNTQALIFASKLTAKTNDAFLQAALDKEDLQNSIRMRYVTMVLCIDDASEEFATEYSNFYKYLPVIANKEDVMNAGYYWAVLQAAIEKEGSAVLYGANSATPILYSDPGSTSQKQEDESPMDISKSLELISSFKFIN